MKTAVAILTSIVVWSAAAVPVSAPDPAPQGFDEAICKLLPWLCPR